MGEDAFEPFLEIVAKFGDVKLRHRHGNQIVDERHMQDIEPRLGMAHAKEIILQPPRTAEIEQDAAEGKVEQRAVRYRVFKIPRDGAPGAIFEVSQAELG